jgi:hypothetical protein
MKYYSRRILKNHLIGSHSFSKSTNNESCCTDCLIPCSYQNDCMACISCCSFIAVMILCVIIPIMAINISRALYNDIYDMNTGCFKGEKNCEHPLICYNNNLVICSILSDLFGFSLIISFAMFLAIIMLCFRSLSNNDEIHKPLKHDNYVNRSPWINNCTFTDYSSEIGSMKDSIPDMQDNKSQDRVDVVVI